MLSMTQIDSCLKLEESYLILPPSLNICCFKFFISNLIICLLKNKVMKIIKYFFITLFF
jgi:hypothetical protein